jgi:uncharacterized membrane protein YkgB
LIKKKEGMLKLRLLNQCKVFEKLILLEKVGYEFRIWEEEDEVWRIEAPFLGLYNDPINLLFNKKNKDLYYHMRDSESNAEFIKDKRIQNILNSLDVKIVGEGLALLINLENRPLQNLYNLINGIIQINTLLTFLKGDK